MSLFKLLQQSKNHKDTMNKLLQSIELDINNIESFMTSMGNIKASQKLIIAFYDHEVK